MILGTRSVYSRERDVVSTLGQKILHYLKSRMGSRSRCLYHRENTLGLAVPALELATPYMSSSIHGHIRCELQYRNPPFIRSSIAPNPSRIIVRVVLDLFPRRSRRYKRTSSTRRLHDQPSFRLGQQPIDFFVPIASLPFLLLPRLYPARGLSSAGL